VLVRPAAFWIILACAALACSDEDEDDAELPLRETREARELSFKHTPRVKHRNRDEFLEDIRDEWVGADDGWVDSLFDTYGRLGFFRREDDVRATAGDSSALVAAFYDPQSDAITLLGKPERGVVVHELVHALQHQHFDLERLSQQTSSLDEQFALAALVEGDATLSQFRFEAAQRRRDPIEAASGLTLDYVRDNSERGLDRVEERPFFFYGRATFAYSYGLYYAASVAGVTGERRVWKTSNIDEVFRNGVPKTTEAVLKAGGEVDAVVPVGIEAVPDAAFPDYDVAVVDTIGAWHTYLLFARVALSRMAARELSLRWDGDQLVVFRERDRAVPPKDERRAGVLWSSAWDRTVDALEVVQLLKKLHGLQGDGSPYSASDGEIVWLEQREERVVFCKNMPEETMKTLAQAAFGGQTPIAPNAGQLWSRRVAGRKTAR
jgi:hypothetical protein